MKTPPLTDYECSRAAWYWRRGYSTAQISGLMNIPEATIANEIERIRTFKKSKITIARQTDGFNGDKVAQAHFLFKQGLTVKEVATTIFMPERTVKANFRAILNYVQEETANDLR